jgi:S-adenosylmethionine:tRNA ribosyltransferase-isomerase
MTRVDLFDYELPEELIAATPAEKRDGSRLLGLTRRTGAMEHRRFSDLPSLLREGDLLVMNDARVIPARLQATKRTGGAAELLLVRPEAGHMAAGADRALWVALVKSAGRLKEGEVLHLGAPQADIRLVRNTGDGSWVVSLGDGKVTPEAIIQAGSMPVPPYIVSARRRVGLPDEMPELDRERYQTVYARRPGAVAAPTAGLHFTEGLLDRLRSGGVEICMVSLLVGPGTFQPVRREHMEDHQVQAEYFHLPADTAAAAERALREGRRVVATGTTTCRVLEYVARHSRWEGQSGWTDLFIYPQFEFRVVGALITNFHLPRSTLLMLVSAFAGRENVLAAYRAAVAAGYRFYSYGDAMFIA